MEYKISIILPVFNVEEFIRDALDSILNQSIDHGNLEVIMVNDCSTDQSGIIMDEYSAKYENFISIHLEKNSGAAGKPRNVGMANATAPYLMFLDPDDYYLEDACETLYNSILSENVDIVFGKYQVDYGSSKRVISTFFDDLTVLKANNVREQPNFLRISPSVWAKIYKREFIIKNDIKFNEGVPGQDLVFVNHAFLNAKGIIFLNKEIVNYRIRNYDNKSMSFNRNKTYMMGLIESYNAVYDIYKRNNSEDLFSIILNDHMSYWMEQLIFSILTDSEKEEVLIACQHFFKKYPEFNLKPEKKHLVPIVLHVNKDDYETAILEINSLTDLLKDREFMETHIFNITSELERKENQITNIKSKLNNNQKQLKTVKKKLKIKKKQIAKLQTVKGYLNYKIRNIYRRGKEAL